MNIREIRARMNQLLRENKMQSPEYKALDCILVVLEDKEK